MRASFRLASALLATALLAGCSGGNLRTPGLSEYNSDSRRDQLLRQTGVSAEDSGITLFGMDRRREARDATEGSGLGVNAYLWRATLDTLSFMPLVSADPFGGVIITDWYAPPAANGERFKATAYVMGRQLRSDGVRVTVFRQVQLPNGQWVDSQVSNSTASELEDRVLARARELRSMSASR